ncbi:MAG: hypothetical protein AB8B93_11270, partial [Pseudomonadales bacterium]
DLAHHYLTSMCDYQSALEDECSIMGRMMSSTVTLEDFERDGDAISYSARLIADGSLSRVDIGNRDYDKVTLRRDSGQQGPFAGEWQRSVDGIETFTAQSSGSTINYTENPDCSGTAKAIRTDAGGHPWELSWRWTSARDSSTFIVQYTECKVNGLNERECMNGSL